MTVWFPWTCQRCGDDFKSPAPARDCPSCASFAAGVLGRGLPFGEMGGE